MSTSGLKNYIGFLCVVLVGFSLLTYLTIVVNEQGLFFLHSAGDEIVPVLHSFRQTHKPLTELNFTALYGGSGQFQVLHPLLDMRRLRLPQQNPSCNDETKPNQIILDTSDKKQTKRALLEDFLNKGISLPQDFLTTAPFVDEWGTSFAYILSQNGQSPYNSKSWIEQHLSFFKVSELVEILNRFQISDSQFLVIARLNESEIEEIIRGVPLVLTKDYLFLKDQSRFGFSPLSYWVYDFGELRNELKEGKFELMALTADSVCLKKTGNGCWTYNSKHMMAYLYRYSVVIVSLVGLVVVTFIGFYLRQAYQKNKEQHKNRLALQVLSHEFRTPVSSMILLIESFSKRHAKFNQEDQDLMTRLSMEVFRLQRIIEMSKVYLQTESHRIQFKSIEISSINNWISDFIAEFDQDIQSQLLSVDRSIHTDPFWLKFVLSSLVQNAVTHGEPPIFIKLEVRRNKVSICIEDRGHCEFRSLDEMTNAFVKSSRSTGMGLGLNIVKFILDDWGTEIHFAKDPTSFTLLFKERV